MEKFRSADEYYDKLAEREAARSGWRTALRYIASVIAFALVVLGVLGSYWIWRDYGEGQPFTWESWRAHVEYRWNEFKAGNVDLN